MQLFSLFADLAFLCFLFFTAGVIFIVTHDFLIKKYPENFQSIFPEEKEKLESSKPKMKATKK